MWRGTSSWLNNPHNATITSFPVTPFGSVPTNVTLQIGGTCHQVRPVAHMLAASVLPNFSIAWDKNYDKFYLTMGVPRHPTPPYILLHQLVILKKLLGEDWK